MKSAFLWEGAGVPEENARLSVERSDTLHSELIAKSIPRNEPPTPEIKAACAWLSQNYRSPKKKVCPKRETIYIKLLVFFLFCSFEKRQCKWLIFIHRWTITGETTVGNRRKCLVYSSEKSRISWWSHSELDGFCCGWIENFWWFCSVFRFIAVCWWPKRSSEWRKKVYCIAY